jgi:hypothetical protein
MHVIVPRSHQALHGAIRMKNRNPALISILGMSLLAASAAWAQDQTQPAQAASSAPPMPATQNTQNAASTPPAASQAPGSSNPGGAGSATYSTAQGQVVINSTMPAAPSAASPPSFEQLANGKKYITKDDANAYPPLANDFLYVSHNGNRISKAQYEHWVKTLN